MKELSIEDKAKRYDEAIERAKSKIKNDKDHVLYEYDILDIFPELKESEDEKKRKEIISFLKSPFVNENITDEKVAPWIEWLEKQGDNTYSWKPTEEQYEALDYAYNNCPDTEMGNYVEGVLETLIDDLYKLSEKQGEQKVTFTSIVETGNGGINALVTKELPTDKIEPKFKVGDWIVFNGFVLHIDEIVDGYYRTTSKGGITNSYDWDIDNTARLWTIQDAKDGDVLRLGCIIAMFKKYIGQEKCICYCSISEDGDFEIPIENGEDNVYGCTDTTPATKEQRELLFTKMKEEGYGWDDENKELKKENLSDFESALFTAFSDAWQQYLLGEKVNVAQWAKEHSSELIEIAKQNDKTIA